MSTTNYPSATPQNQPPKKDFRGLIIGLLAVGLLGTWGYLLWNNNKNEQTIQSKDTQIAKVTDEKSDLQRSFDASLARLDSVTVITTSCKPNWPMPTVTSPKRRLKSAAS